VFDQFTELAKRAVVASQDAALALGHDFIGTEHLLLGLICTAGTAGEVLRAQGVELGRARDETVRQTKAAGVPATGGQPAKDALSTLGIDIAEIQRRADETFGPGAFTFPRPAYTSRAKTVLELAVREAHAQGRQQIDTEHVLFGLLMEGQGMGVSVLTALGIDTAAVRAVLEREASATGRSGA
jgi:ATP-dependent Clp protease ATP-binding subunit ClpC